MKNNMNATQLAEYVGKCWGSNDEEFNLCFDEDAIIEHPFFSEPVSPQIAMEVMNATVKVTTSFHKVTILEGKGDGVEDVVRMEFIESGNCAGYVTEYDGNMIVDGWIKNHKFTKFKVYGYDVIKNSKRKSTSIATKPTEFFSVDKLSEDIAAAWTSNDMEKFIGLFSEEALIFHPIINRPATPKEVADIINSGTEGISIPRKAKIISGIGDGKEDIVDMYFEETGEQLGYIPEEIGLMHVTLEIKEGKIKEMLVHGYTPIKNTIEKRILDTLHMKSNQKALVEVGK